MSEKENNYTVYMHTSPSEKRYIGITRRKPEKRWNNGNGYKRNIYFYSAIEKYGWNNIKHEILFEDLTKEEAGQREIELIACYKSNQREFGCNIQNGGNCIGSHSEETKKKMSIAKKGMVSKLRGVPKTRESKQKMSESAKKRFLKSENHPMYGFSHREESKQKMRESHTGLKQSEEHKRHNGESHKKPILQYSKKGEFIERYNSSKDAGDKLGIHSTSITACCKGRLKSAGGYIWRYAYDEEYKELRQTV